ncbi:MAG: hypothetical protein FWE74_05335, partial [Oscillospiraceae bacterium]|nr:hypothetical protein [Oscillospiraceae bacterium]
MSVKNKISKKLVALLLPLCMVLTIIPVISTPVQATSTGHVITSALNFIDNNLPAPDAQCSVCSSDHCWVWNNGTRTLTLNGVNMIVASGAAAINLPAGSTVNTAAGSVNNITHTAGQAYALRSPVSVAGGGAMTVGGSGTLNLTNNSSNTGNDSAAIFADGDITITGGTINISANSTNATGNAGHLYGINSNGKNIAISNATIRVQAVSTTGGGVQALTTTGSISITNSDIDIVASRSGGSGTSRGIFSGAGLTFTSGSLKIVVDKAAEASGTISASTFNLPAAYWYTTDSAAKTLTSHTPTAYTNASTHEYTHISSLGAAVTAPGSTYNENYRLYLDPTGILRAGGANGANVTHRFNPTNISFNTSNDTWTFNNFNFTSNASTAVFVPSTSPAVTINLVGSSVVTSVTAITNIASYGIDINSAVGVPVMITGAGTLTVTGGDSGTNASYGINAAHLTFNSGIINAGGGTTTSGVSGGVHTNGTLIVSGAATFNAAGGTANTATNSRGINVTGAAGNFIMNGGTVNATAVNGGRSIEIANTSQMTANGGTVNAASGINLLGRLNLNENVINASHVITTSALARSIIATSGTAITERTNAFYNATGGKGNSATSAFHIWSSTDASGVVSLSSPGWRIATPAEILAIELLDIAQANVATQTVIPSGSRTLAADAAIPAGVKLVITANGAGRVTVGADGSLTINGGTIDIDNSAQNAITINDNRTMTISGGAVNVANTGGSGINLAGANSTLTIGSAGATSDVVLNLNGETSLIGTGIITGVNSTANDSKAKIIVGATAPTRTVDNFFNASGSAANTISANMTYAWDADAGGTGTAGWKAQSTSCAHTWVSNGNGTHNCTTASGCGVTNEACASSNPANCTVCEKCEAAFRMHTPKADDCTTCSVCTAASVTGLNANHIPKAADCTECSECTAVGLTSCVTAPKCAACQAACSPHTNRTTANCTVCGDCGAMGLERECNDSAPCTAHACSDHTISNQAEADADCMVSLVCACGHIITSGAAGHTPKADDCTACSVCTATNGTGLNANHTAGTAATCTSAQFCVNCTHQMAAESGHDFGTSNNNGTHTCKRDGCTATESCSPRTSGATCTTCGYRTPSSSRGGGGGSTDEAAPPANIVQTGSAGTIPPNFAISAATVNNIKGDLPFARLRITATGNVPVNLGTDTAGQNAVLTRLNADGELEVVN